MSCATYLPASGRAASRAWCCWGALELFVGGWGCTRVRRERPGFVLALLMSAAVSVPLAVGASVLRLLPVGADWVRWAGLGSWPRGLALRVFASSGLGYVHPLVQILPGHHLVTSGPYRFVRHPSYRRPAAILRRHGVALGDWLSVAIMATVPALGVLYRIRVEEEALLAAFGRSNRTYMGSVGSLLPLFGPCAEVKQG